MGRSRTAYRITVRQLESLIRLSEALARLHCDDMVRPSYVREAFRLLRKSIIHVETEDVTFDEGEEFDDGPPDDEMEVEEGDADEQGGRQGEEESAPPPAEVVGVDDMGEAKEAEGNDATRQPPPKPAKVKKAKKKKKTQISFEEYESISNAIATYLRSRESETERVEGEEDEESTYLTWGQVVEWYLEQCESQIGDSLEELNRLKKLTNLVIRRLVKVDHVLVVIGDGEIPELERKLAVHPNYVVGA